MARCRAVVTTSGAASMCCVSGPIKGWVTYRTLSIHRVAVHGQGSNNEPGSQSVRLSVSAGPLGHNSLQLPASADSIQSCEAAARISSRGAGLQAHHSPGTQQRVGVCAGFPDALRSVLESTRITKAGVGIKNDCEKLWLDKRCKLNASLDINTELNARQLPCGSHMAEYTTFTLAEGCERLLSRGLPKPQSLRYESNPSPCSRSGFTIWGRT